MNNEHLLCPVKYAACFSAHVRNLEPDPDKFAHRESLVESLLGGRRRESVMEAREREFLSRQQEVRELMEQYNGKDKRKIDNTLNEVLADRPDDE